MTEERTGLSVQLFYERHGQRTRWTADLILQGVRIGTVTTPWGTSAAAVVTKVEDLIAKHDLTGLV